MLRLLALVGLVVLILGSRGPSDSKAEVASVARSYIEQWHQGDIVNAIDKHWDFRPLVADVVGDDLDKLSQSDFSYLTMLAGILVKVPNQGPTISEVMKECTFRFGAVTQGQSEEEFHANYEFMFPDGDVSKNRLTLKRVEGQFRIIDSSQGERDVRPMLRSGYLSVKKEGQDVFEFYEALAIEVLNKNLKFRQALKSKKREG